MVTLKRFLKMRSSDEKELEKIINNMSEQDAKAYLKAVMKVINKNMDASFDIGKEMNIE